MPARCFAARLQLREEIVHEVVAQLLLGAFGQSQVFLDGELGEDVAVFGNVGDAALHDLVRSQRADRRRLQNRDAAGAVGKPEDAA